MKLRTEIVSGAEEEIIIRAPELNEKTERLLRLISSAIGSVSELALGYNGEEHFVPISELLFFETDGDRLCAHTAERMYGCSLRLCELHKLLPSTFVRASKSCIANTAEVSSISRSLSGVGTVSFRGTHKTVCLSRMYYKSFHDTIEETRLKK